MVFDARPDKGEHDTRRTIARHDEIGERVGYRTGDFQDVEAVLPIGNCIRCPAARSRRFGVNEIVPRRAARQRVVVFAAVERICSGAAGERVEAGAAVEQVDI